MDFITVINGIYLTLGAVLVGLLAYLRHRRKKRSLAVMESQLSTETEADNETFSDNFYCFMLKDGTVRSGYITDDAGTDSPTEHGDTA